MKPIRSAGLLAAGKSTQAVLALAFMALAARTLGPEQFGVLILVHSVLLAVAKTVRFQTWRALVHYGAKAQEAEDTPRLLRVVQFSYVLDALSALAAYGIILLISGPAIGLLGLDVSLVGTLRVYGAAILFMVVNGAPYGILQLFDRFDDLGVQATLAPLVRFLGTAYLFLTGGSLSDFFLVWFAAEVVASVGLNLFAVRVLVRSQLSKGFWTRNGSVMRPEPGIWRYVGGTQIASTLDLTTTHLPVLLTGGLLGPTAAGIFRIAKQFASLLVKPQATLFGRAIYPDLARLSARNADAERRQMMIRTALVVGGISALVFALLASFGKPMIQLIAGPGFEESYAPMLWLGLSGLIWALAFGLEPLLIATGMVRETVLIRAVATTCYLPVFYWLALEMGVSGAAIAAVVNAVLTTALLFWAGRDMLRGGATG
jgi:O-antigen/teichoic acid export membrane protein